ncbi:hypothetical protein ADIS_2645 [Lunatimonas lonarensis]|uniref:HTH luxR-type domain-containing protein n=1 Tax=Lunatimonas lonarensis TaxID=1232681 RepID=R7ZS01_9BACT|nr:helix-turn-helix transcriptional regulator [Lunatimonas lonarensis]EON76774.1 hypothetical protein ADIS_2645 [Lunatimonas lonarensis]
MEPSDHHPEQPIAAVIQALRLLGNAIPGIKIIQRSVPFQNLYLCPRGVKHLNLSESFFYHLPQEESKKMVFDPADPYTCLLGVQDPGDPSKTAKSFYIRHERLQQDHQVELIIVQNLFPSGPEKRSYLLLQIIPLSFQPWAIPKIKRMATEMHFRKTHQGKFNLLSDRNKEVLSLMVRCLKAEEIADHLCIGVDTVNSHKKRIKEMLETNRNEDLFQYGMAFDLLADENGKREIESHDLSS